LHSRLTRSEVMLMAMGASSNSVRKRSSLFLSAASALSCRSLARSPRMPKARSAVISSRSSTSSGVKPSGSSM